MTYVEPDSTSLIMSTTTTPAVRQAPPLVGDTEQGSEESFSPGRLFLYGFCALFVLLFYSTFVWFSFSDMGPRGQFGDMFGGFNALISCLTLAGVFYTIYLQRIELRRAHTEARDQANASRKQQVDSTFFQLVQLQSNILADLTLEGETGEFWRGRAAFAYAQQLLRKKYLRERVGEPQNRVKAVSKTYDDVNALTLRVLGHYFRNLYHIIKFVDDSSLEPAEKKRYTSIARAQLSEDETVVLFFNCKTARAEKFEPLIEKYALLEHLPKWIFDRVDLDVYKAPAYGTNRELLIILAGAERP